MKQTNNMEDFIYKLDNNTLPQNLPQSSNFSNSNTSQGLSIDAVNGLISEALRTQTERMQLVNGSLQSQDFLTGSSGWQINATGDVEFNNGVFRGTLTAASINIPNTTSANSFHVDSNGNTWWGATTLGASVASVLNTGAATFTSGTIGGWTLSSTTLTSSTITLNAGASTILVGTGGNQITIDGTTGTISSNGATWSASGNGTLVGFGHWSKILTNTISAVSVPSATPTTVTSFSGLTGDTDDEYEIEFEVATSADLGTATTSAFYVTFNNDTTAVHYGYAGTVVFAASGGTVGKYSSNAGLANILIATADTNQTVNTVFGTIKIKASKTISGTTRLMFSDVTTGDFTTSIGSTSRQSFGGQWIDTTNQLTSIELWCKQSTGSSKTVSGKATIYKINR